MKSSTLVLIGSLARNADVLAFFAFRPMRASKLVGDYYASSTSSPGPLSVATDPLQ